MYPFFKRPPTVKYPGKMTQQSKSSFVSLKMEDPASNSGIISIYKVKFLKIIMKTKIFLFFYQSCVPYLPTIGHRKQKMAMFGDQGFYERGI